MVDSKCCNDQNIICNYKKLKKKQGMDKNLNLIYKKKLTVGKTYLCNA